MHYHYKRRSKYKPSSTTPLLIGFVVGILAMMVLTIISIKIVELSNDTEVVDLESQVSALEIEYDSFMIMHQQTLLDHQTEIETYTQRIERLETEMFTEAENELAVLKKYEYVIRKAPANGGVSFGLLSHADRLCKEKNVNPHLVWSIVEIESSFKSTARNTSSDARGFGQFLKSTAKSIYEKYLCYGTYNHEFAYDPYIGIEMIIEYLRYLEDYHNGNIVSMIQNYSGDSGMSYYNKLSAQMKRNGYDISVIDYI